MNAKKYRVTLTPEERETLESLTKKGKATARSICRARILLQADASPQGPDWTDECIHLALDVGMATIYRTRQSFVEDGLEIALRPRKANREYQRRLNSEQEAHLIAMACGKPPPGFAHWSLRLLARRFVDLYPMKGISPETVRQTLKKTN